MKGKIFYEQEEQLKRKFELQYKKFNPTFILNTETFEVKIKYER